jgi:hypothetical protein
VWLAVAGLASGAAVLVRPNLAPLALVIIGAASVGGTLTRRHGEALVGPASNTSPVRRHGAWLTPALIVATALVPAAFSVAFVQHVLYGSPLSSGYGSAELLFRLGHVPANLARFPRWLVETQSPFVVLGAVAPLAFWAITRTRARSRVETGGFDVTHAWLATTLWCFTVGAFAAYLPYVPFDGWWFLRFWLPGIPPLVVLAVGTAVALSEWLIHHGPPACEAIAWVSQRVRTRDGASALPSDVSSASEASAGRAQARSLAVAAIAGLLACTGLAAWQLGVARDRSVFQLQRLERKFLVSGEYAASLPANAVVLTIWHSGAIRYYANRPIVMWDALAPDGLDSALGSLHQQGREAFLLLETWEEQGFKARFGASSAIALLDWPPRARFGNEATLWAIADRERFLRGEPTLSERVWTR